MKFALSQVWTSLKASLITGMAAHADVAPADLNFLVASSSSFIFPTIFSYIVSQLTLIIYFIVLCVLCAVLLVYVLFYYLLCFVICMSAKSSTELMFYVICYTETRL